MKQVYQFVDNNDNVYGEFILYQDGKNFYWYTEEDETLVHGPFSTELNAYNDAQGYD